MLKFPLRHAIKRGVAPSLSTSCVFSRNAMFVSLMNCCDNSFCRLGSERLIIISWNICRKGMQAGQPAVSVANKPLTLAAVSLSISAFRDCVTVMGCDICSKKFSNKRSLKATKQQVNPFSTLKNRTNASTSEDQKSRAANCCSLSPRCRGLI